MPRYRVEGTVSEGYEPVREAFVKLYDQGREDCSQLCAYVGGRRVVDLWGSADGDDSYDGDTLHTIFSSTKSLTAIAVACLVDRGLLDYGEKICTYWPEFGKKGKEEVRLVDVLRHEAGIAWLNHTFEPEDLLAENIKEKNSVGKVLEEVELRFPPEEMGTKREYHGVTRGWILNEVFSRADPQGRTVGQFVREEVSGPLGADFNIGATKEELERYKQLTSFGVGKVLLHSFLPSFVSSKVEVGVGEMMRMANIMRKLGARKGEPKTPPNVSTIPEKPKMEQLASLMDDPRMRSGEMPSANGGASARGLARVGACVAAGGQLDGVRILSEEAVAKMHSGVTAAKDAGLLGIVTDMTQGGLGVYK